MNSYASTMKKLSTRIASAKSSIRFAARGGAKLVLNVFTHVARNMAQLFRRLVAFVAAVLSFLRHKLTNLRRHPEPEPEPEKNPDEEAMTEERMREAWYNAQLGEILVQNNAVAVVRTLTGVIELPVAQQPELKASGRWLLGQTSEMKSALAPRKKNS